MHRSCLLKTSLTGLALLAALLLSGCASSPYKQSQCLSGDCINGTGTLKLADGTRMQGRFLNGYLSGPQSDASVNYPDGSRLSGEHFDRGQLDGPGVFNAPGVGVSYHGSFKNGLYDGYGTLYTPRFVFEGRFRSGQPVNGRMSLEGMRIQLVENLNGLLRVNYTMADDSVGIGDFAVSSRDLSPGFAFIDTFQRQGLHTLRYSNGDTYQASYQKGLQVGHAEWRSANGQEDRIEHWKNGDKISERPGVLTIASQAKRSKCRMVKSHQDFVWFGKSCRSGFAHGEGLAYSKDGQSIISGRFTQGALIEGLYKSSSDTYEGRFSDLKLNGEGAHYVDDVLQFKGQFLRGERKTGWCKEAQGMAPCEYYDGQRIMEQHELLSQNSTNMAAQLRAAKQASARVSEKLSEVADEAIETLNRRNRSWQRAREQEASRAAFDQAFYNSLSAAKADLQRTMTQSWAQTNQAISNYQAQQSTQDSLGEQLYQQGQERIARQQVEASRQAQNTPKSTQPSASKAAYFAQFQQDCESKGGEFSVINNGHTPNCTIRKYYQTFVGNQLSPIAMGAEGASSKRLSVSNEQGAANEPSTGSSEESAASSSWQETPVKKPKNKGKSYDVKVPEAQGLCWMTYNSKREERWECAGQNNVTGTLVKDVLVKANSYIGCDNPRRVYHNIRFSRKSGREVKYEKAIIYACGEPLPSYNAPLSKHYNIQYPADVVFVEYRCTNSSPLNPRECENWNE